MKLTASLIALSAAALFALPAAAATAGYIKFEGVDGEAVTEIPFDGWSFGACNAGSCATVVSPRDQASGQATGKRSTGVTKPTASQNTQSLRSTGSGGGAGKVSMSDLSVTRTVGDVDGDGQADLAYAGTLPEVSSFTLTFDKTSPVLMKVCQGKHIAKAELRRGAETMEITDAHVTCSANADSTVGKQSQGATFGEKVSTGMASSGSVTIKFTSGQMKHTKTGHVTILK